MAKLSLKYVTASVMALFLTASASFAGTHHHAKHKTHATKSRVTTSHSAFTAEQKKEFGPMVREYLLKNPEVFMEVAKAFRVKQQQEAEKAAHKAIESSKSALFMNANLPAVGPKKPSAYLVEFFDYQCGHCKQMKRVIDQLIEKNPKLRVVFIDFPIFGPTSMVGAKVALAANMQGKYMKVHEALLNAGNPMTKEKALRIAKEAGLNMAKLKKDMESPQVVDTLKANEQLAEKLRISGTPALIVANKDISVFKMIGGAIPFSPLNSLITAIKRGIKV